MPKNSPESLLNQIRDARHKRLRWTQLAETLSQLKRSAEMRERFPARADFWEEMGRLTGYSQNALQRMESTLLKIREIEKEDRKELRRALGIKKWWDGALLETLDHFPKAELFARIRYLDQNEAFHLLTRMQSERFSVKQLQHILTDLSNSRPGGQRFIQPGKKTLDVRQRFAALDEHKVEIYGSDDVNIYFRSYSFSYVSADAVAISCDKNGGISFIDAIQMVPKLGGLQDQPFRDLLMATDFRSSFFRNLWLLLRETLDRDSVELDEGVQRLEHAIDELGVQGVGILGFTEDGTLRIIRRPKRDGRPPLRHQVVLNEVVRQGVQDFGTV